MCTHMYIYIYVYIYIYIQTGALATCQYAIADWSPAGITVTVLGLTGCLLERVILSTLNFPFEDQEAPFWVPWVALSGPLGSQES